MKTCWECREIDINKRHCTRCAMFNCPLTRDFIKQAAKLEDLTQERMSIVIKNLKPTEFERY